MVMYLIRITVMVENFSELQLQLPNFLVHA